MATIDPITDARNLAEAELLRVRASTRSIVKQGMFQVVAVLLAVGGLLMLLVAGFLALSEAYGALNAALMMGGVQFFLALVLILLARPLSRSSDLEAAEEAARRARADLASDTEAIQSVFRLLSGDASAWTADKRISILVAAFGAGLGLGMRGPRSRD